MIRLRNVEKVYGKRGSHVVACRVPELDVDRGEQVALVGPSGCGKTTLLHLISGLLLPTNGEIEVEGAQISILSESKRDKFRAANIGYVHQTFNLLAPFTALENVALAVLFSRGTGAKHLDPAELLTRVGLGDRLHHKPAQLSVGQQQRVAIARALVNRPSLLLADEPLGNQDVETGKQVLDLLLGLAREVGATVMMVTHDPAQASALEREISLPELAKAGA